MSEELVTTSGTPMAVAITGSGGSGAVTAGMILLEAVGEAGWFGLMTRSAGPQIRGGESAAMLRFGPEPVECLGDRFDLLVGLDWRNAGRFADEIPLDAASLVLTDSGAGPVPEALLRCGPQVYELPLRAAAEAVPQGRLNMVAIGTLGTRVGLPLAALEGGLRRTLGGKGAKVVEPALACLRQGFDLGWAPFAMAAVSAPGAPERWVLSGNDAAGLGALRGGVRFVAAYPITPATEILEWLAPRLEQLGGSLLQAEDEVASVNMIIGAAFGGVPALTATSGPGLSLMMEGIGLAVASETPIVVVDVMRGGPSTGIPTKPEQSDLNIAVYGLHGDAPHLVLAPLSVGDCAFTTQWAVGLAEHLQTAAIVLSDQSLGQSRAVTAPAPEPTAHLTRLRQTSPGERYQRYALTEYGVSPMTEPGIPGGMYTAEGLEHTERGTPSSAAADHRVQLEKRRIKLDDFDYGDAWAEIRGEGETCVLTWGSTAGAVFEAAERARAAGTPLRVIALRLLAPLRRRALMRALEGARRLLVVEQNQSGQLFHLLNAHRVLPPTARRFARPGPLPLRPGEILEHILGTD